MDELTWSLQQVYEAAIIIIIAILQLRKQRLKILGVLRKITQLVNDMEGFEPRQAGS